MQYSLRGDGAQMINSILRSFIIYVCIIAVVRFMGKRQIGELQPSELVITIILSEVASMPLEDINTPLLPSVVLVFLLACFEVLSSDLSVKFPFFRKLLQGNPILVIEKGKIIEENIHSIRYSMDDLTEALRLKDVFDVAAVDFAYIETNGGLSVKLKKKYRPPTKSDENSNDGTIPFLVVDDGKIIDRDFDKCNMSIEKIEKILRKNKFEIKDILLMTADSSGEINIVTKAGVK